MNALRFLRTIHGWIGVLVIPWVLLYGLTGFYLNHERDMAFLFGSDEVDMLWREDQPGRLSDEAAARAWFAQVFPDLPVEKVTDEDYHGKPAFQIATGSLLVIAPKNSSFYFDKTSHVRQLHDDTGAVINHHVYWPSILKELHTHGWLRSPLGTNSCGSLQPAADRLRVDRCLSLDHSPLDAIKGPADRRTDVTRVAAAHSGDRETRSPPGSGDSPAPVFEQPRRDRPRPGLRWPRRSRALPQRASTSRRRSG